MLRLRASGLLVGRLRALAPRARLLRSKEPAVAWDPGVPGCVACVAVGARLTPETHTHPAWGPPPLILSARLNGPPPPALRYALNDPEFLSAVGLPGGAAPSRAPAAVLQLLPEEAEPFGAWLLAWHDWCKSGEPSPQLRPEPPVPLDETSGDPFDAAAALGGAWTVGAASQFQYWYAREKV